MPQSFAGGLSQVLYSMAVIELAKPGQEATTYELITTVGKKNYYLSGLVVHVYIAKHSLSFKMPNYQCLILVACWGRKFL